MIDAISDIISFIVVAVFIAFYVLLAALPLLMIAALTKYLLGL